MVIRTIEDFLPYFQRIRDRTRAVVDRVPPERLEWRPDRGRFSAGDLIRHIAGTERWMWAENVHGRPSRYPGHHEELARGPDEVVAYMDALHRESMERFGRLTPEDLRRRCPTPGGIELTTWKWLRAMIEHEVHHRGQLYALLGLAGVEAPPLYGLTERQVFEASLSPEEPPE